MEDVIAGAARDRVVGVVAAVGCAGFLDGMAEGVGILAVLLGAAACIAWRLRKW